MSLFLIFFCFVSHLFSIFCLTLVVEMLILQLLCSCCFTRWSFSTDCVGIFGTQFNEIRILYLSHECSTAKLEHTAWINGTTHSKNNVIVSKRHRERDTHRNEEMGPVFLFCSPQKIMMLTMIKHNDVKIEIEEERKRASENDESHNTFAAKCKWVS